MGFNHVKMNASSAQAAISTCNSTATSLDEKAAELLSDGSSIHSVWIGTSYNVFFTEVERIFAALGDAAEVSRAAASQIDSGLDRAWEEERRREEAERRRRARERASRAAAAT